MTEQGFTLPSQTARPKRGKPGPRDQGGPGNVLGVSYDQWNRALLPTPSNPEGPNVPWTRVTTITGAANQNEGLRIWTERLLVESLANWPAGRAMLATHADDPKELDKIREQAKERGGIHDAANYGTAWHRDFQRWAELGGWWNRAADLDGPFQAQPEVERDILAATTKVEQEGLVIQRCEVLVVNEHLRVAGKLDHLWADIAATAGDPLRVGDGKTGKEAGTDPVKVWTTALQLSAYANMTHVYDTVTKTFTRLDQAFNIDRQIAYLLAVRDGVAELLELPIAESWREFLAAWELHQGKSRLLSVRPVGRPVIIELAPYEAPPGPAIDPWEAGAGADIWSSPELTEATGRAVDELLAAEQPATEPEWAEEAAIAQDQAAAGEQGLGGTGEPLAELAGPGERGCSVCGRKGHRATIKGAPNPVCLGDADPAKRGAGAAPAPASPDPAPWPLPGEPDPVPDGTNATTIGDVAAGQQSTVQGGVVVTVPDADFCDAHCDGSATARPLQVQRNDRGNATGAYECSGCGKRATMAAIRHHMTTPGLFSPGGRPVAVPEQQAAAARLKGSEPIPEPPKQQQSHKHGWSRSDGTGRPAAPEAGIWWCPGCGEWAAPMQQSALTQQAEQEAPKTPVEDWDGWIRDAANTQVLGQIVTRMQATGAGTVERMQLASERWSILVHEGA